MQDNLKDPNEQADELDLLALLENVISFLRRYKDILFICSLVGLLGGILLYTLSPKQYTSILILRPNSIPSYSLSQSPQKEYILNTSEQIRLIEIWDDLLNKKSYASLSKVFQCGETLLKKVTSLTAEEIDKPGNMNMGGSFTVIAMVKDTTVLEELQRALINGLQNNDYVKIRVEEERSGLKGMIAKIRLNIAKLDSIQTDIAESLYRPKTNGGPVILDITGINGQLVELQRELLEYEYQLKFSDALLVLKSFERPGGSKAVSPHRKMVFAGLGAGFVFGYILSLYLYIRRKMKYRIKS